MERLELIVILSLLAGLMFVLGWVGSLIHTKFFQKTDDQKIITGLYRQINNAQHQNEELLAHQTQQEQYWQEEIDRLKEENNDYLKTHRLYQDKIFELEQKLRDSGY
ncbi:MAG: hypothetical protein OXC82_07415 [Rhodobacteraceae bacterium]|nr:hypothetical protein [Paracoccaceae bacterium]MCY4250245.1 hypothetical protein [Paracoccaceae bacterium]MCY4307804.1 hypothetical protein [Paracoccaceae bacterium]